MFWKRSISALIDVVFIYCIGYQVQLLIMRLIFIDPFIVFTISWICYYTICYWFFNGRTLTKALIGLQVVGNTTGSNSIKHLVIRDVVCKFIILLSIPAYVLHRVHFYDKFQVLITAVIILSIIGIMLLLFFIYKRPWWEVVSNTKTIQNRVTSRSLRSVAFIIIAGIFIITIYVKISPFINRIQFPWSRCFPEYPLNNETKVYADFINTQSINPVDYVFDLFDKYDLVVLNERLHPEYTQYELISKIVGDPRFAVKIGNIYTEYGSQSSQDKLTLYMNTIFPNEDTLNMATAWLQENSCALWPLWESTNLFDILFNKTEKNLMNYFQKNYGYTPKVFTCF